MTRKGKVAPTQSADRSSVLPEFKSKDFRNMPREWGEKFFFPQYEEAIGARKRLDRVVMRGGVEGHDLKPG